MMNCGDSTVIVHPLFQEEDDGLIPISPLQLYVAPCHVTTAIHLNEEWHSRLPTVSKSNITRTSNNLCFAAEYKNRYYASAIWTDPISRTLNGQGILELRRMAISDNAPKNTASRMIKLMRKEIKAKMPHIKRLISYQDTDVHIGTIYAASGWMKTFSSKPSKKGWNTRERNKMQTTSEKVRWEFILREDGEKR